ncbi:hypothetical protein PSECIP111951_04045 [Pseudoalteromonas holothuriae]|uniref:Uncharacterized protein n=1 Tax=Pseudoalteromonas holothuriae TaxID=2963714 RepID=A0A9W4R4N3_9GAMM|nr:MULTISPECIES: hypothetical protein [unclassified Pseudoalteromonas]CAH9067009.1 hypothetical protein PSECIP111854_04005 [Pseudoalteromonas sp. CIP111854]CAH9068159.1 hypothetical protein PSECIP111951_04045 [Pseudoalteromonas sp. CIP111951]
MSKTVKASLLFCAIMALITAIAHLSCIGIGVQCYRAQLAPQFIINSAKQGTWHAPVITLTLSCLFALCGAYALAAMKLIRQLPLQQLALLTLAIICLIRGLAAIPLSIIYWQQTTVFSLIASVIWFFCGCGYALGWYASRSKKLS